MKNFGKLSFVFALLAVGLGVSTSRASAQSMAAGTFTLPVEAHWGQVALPAGDYTFAIEQRGTGPLVTVRQVGGKSVGMFLSQSVSQIAESRSDSLTLTRVGDEMFVSSFQLGLVGLSLQYTMPRTVELASAEKLPAQQSAMLAASTH